MIVLSAAQPVTNGGRSHHPTQAMSQDTSDSAPIEDVDHYSEFMVHSAAEVAFILRSLKQKGAQISAYFNHGKDSLLTSVLDVDADEEELILDVGSNATANRAILSANRVTFVTSLERVRIQFTTGRLQATSFGGREAMLAAFPDSVLKLQRRDSYRLALPMNQALKCQIHAEGKHFEVAVVDISLGGLGLTDFPSGLERDIGAVYKDCKIVLPEAGTVVADLEVRSAFSVKLRSGATSYRVGCEFKALRPAMESMIQRYINRVDRERRAKLG